MRQVPQPAPGGPESSRHVLLLYSEPRLTPAIVSGDQAFRSTLESGSPGPVYVYTEYLDLNSLDGPARLLLLKIQMGVFVGRIVPELVDKPEAEGELKELSYIAQPMN